jgi:hypothetical protein
MRLAAAFAAILLTGCAAQAPQPVGPQPTGYTRHYGDAQTEVIEACQEAVEIAARKAGITPELATTLEVQAVAHRLYQKCLRDSGAAI